MAIKYNCPKCGKTIHFPDTPNFEKDKYEQLAHSLYTAAANNGKPCADCEFGRK